MAGASRSCGQVREVRAISYGLRASHTHPSAAPLGLAPCRRNASTSLRRSSPKPTCGKRPWAARRCPATFATQSRHALLRFENALKMRSLHLTRIARGAGGRCGSASCSSRCAISSAKVTTCRRASKSTSRSRPRCAIRGSTRLTERSRCSPPRRASCSTARSLSSRSPDARAVRLSGPRWDASASANSERLSSCDQRSAIASRHARVRAPCSHSPPSGRAGLTARLAMDQDLSRERPTAWTPKRNVTGASPT